MNGKSFSKIEKSIRSASYLYIYGAGIVGYGVCEAVSGLYGACVKAYVTTERKEGQTAFAGRPLLAVKELRADAEVLILVATPSVYRKEITETLEKYGQCDFLVLSDLDIYELMRRFFRREYGFTSIADLQAASVADDASSEADLEFSESESAFISAANERKQLALPTCRIYMAKHVKDAELIEQAALPSHIQPIQAGAVLAGKKICPQGDDTGENISNRNYTYSELSVTYWVWKNDVSDYKGICHYRRFLALSEDDYQILFMNNVDAVLPLPYLCKGDASFQWKRYVKEEDMDLLLSVMSEDEREAALRALSKPYIYNHNLVLAKREVFDDYCAWLFGILFATEQRILERDGKLAPRLMGYLGEVLTSIYFTERAESLRIVHAPERWLA